MESVTFIISITQNGQRPKGFPMQVYPKYVVKNLDATPELSFHETEAEALANCHAYWAYVYTLIDNGPSYYMSHTRSNLDTREMWTNSSDAVYELVECSNDNTPYWEFCNDGDWDEYQRSIKHWHEMRCIYRPWYE